MCIVVSGEQLLDGSAYLSLSANCVAALNTAFDRIHEADLEISFETLPTNNPRVPFMNEIQILYDFVQKITKLKVRTQRNRSSPESLCCTCCYW